MFTVFSPIVQTFASNACGKDFLGLIPWYQYLPTGSGPGGSCTIKLNQGAILGAHSPLLLIALAVVDDLLRIAALVAVGYVMFGGILYMTSGGSPDGTKRAQNTIINALIGVVIAILAASVVAFIGNQLGA